MQEMAALTERRQVAWMAVARIVVEMGRRQKHPRCCCVIGRGEKGAFDQFPTAVAPDAPVFVPPPAVAEMADQPPVWPVAMLAPPIRTLKTDHGRELLPVDGIEPAMFGTITISLASARLGRRKILLEPDSKGYVRARRRIPTWIAARVTKARTVEAMVS